MSKKDDVIKNIKRMIEIWEETSDSNSTECILDIKYELKELEEDSKENEIPKPMGDFIIESEFEGIALPNGQYYHYSDVCILLKRMKNSDNT